MGTNPLQPSSQDAEAEGLFDLEHNAPSETKNAKEEERSARNNATANTSTASTPTSIPR